MPRTAGPTLRSGKRDEWTVEVLDEDREDLVRTEAAKDYHDAVRRAYAAVAEASGRSALIQRTSSWVVE